VARRCVVARRSYKAFDEEDGIEVAWNQVKLRNVEEREKNALFLEVETLKRLKHPNIIRFYDSWTHSNDKSASLTVNFITELCGATLRECAPRATGPLRLAGSFAVCPGFLTGAPFAAASYTQVHKKVDVRAIKNWSRQILQGLEYMHHELSPPVIHRDVKLDNIFINGNSGDVKIGDLGLARTMGAHKMAHTCVGARPAPLRLGKRRNP
jgi:WNK lysine deficient protein kinase